MALVEVWTPGTPAGGEDPKGGDDDIRQKARAVSERARRGCHYWPDGAVDQAAGKHVAGDDPDGSVGEFVVFESNGHAGNRTTEMLVIGDGAGSPADTMVLGDGLTGARPYTFIADTVQGKRDHTIVVPLPGGATGRQAGVLFQNRGGGTLTLLEVDACCFTAPVTTNLDIDIHKITTGWTDPSAAGTTIATAAPVISILATAFRAAAVVTTFAAATLAVGDAWAFEIDTLSSADNIVVFLKVRRTS